VVDEAERFPADELRRFVVALLTAHGWTAIQAGSIAAYRLWLDTAEARGLGIARLPGLLDGEASGTIKPGEAGRLASERSAVAVLEAESAAPELVLIRAGELASQKAGETGIGLVRVVGLKGEATPSAPVLAEMALGPNLALALGPGAAWGMAIPSQGGLPAVLDSSLGPKGAKPRGKAPAALRDLVPGAGWLAGEDSVVIGAIQFSAFDDAERFQERMAMIFDGWANQAGLFLPETFAKARQRAAGEGLAVEEEAWRKLGRAAELHGVERPSSRKSR
jgi:LDH2 family malate/lactate/ureidoglycolate dehydrogenase